MRGPGYRKPMTDREAVQRLIRSRLDETYLSEPPIARFTWFDAAVLALGFLVLMSPAIILWFVGV